MEPGGGPALRSSMVGSILGGAFAWRRACSVEGLTPRGLKYYYGEASMLNNKGLPDALIGNPESLQVL